MLLARLSADLADQKRTGRCGAPHTRPRNKVYWGGPDVVWSKCPGKLSRRQPILKRIIGVDTNDELTDAERESQRVERLLARDARTNKLIIADGYHRLCAVYMLDEDAVIPYKIV